MIEKVHKQDDDITGIGTSNLQYSIALAPLFFVRSGTVGRGGYLSDSGRDSYYWSSRVYTDTAFQYTYYLYFNASRVGSSDRHVRYNGRPLRCLVVGKV